MPLHPATIPPPLVRGARVERRPAPGGRKKKNQRPIWGSAPISAARQRWRLPCCADAGRARASSCRAPGTMHPRALHPKKGRVKVEHMERQRLPLIVSPPCRPTTTRCSLHAVPMHGQGGKEAHKKGAKFVQNDAKAPEKCPFLASFSYTCHPGRTRCRAGTTSARAGEWN